ncbi:MAG: hypothetical protein AAB357_06160 [Actinomycetota bacterium]
MKPLIAIPLIAIALAGCSAQPPAPKETAAATEQKPLFATDAEALAAAEAAYANYLEVSDQIARDGGANPERLKGIVSDQLYKESSDVFITYLTNSINVDGSTSFDSLHVADISSTAATFYVCLDVSGTNLLSADSEIVTPQNRQSRLPIVFGVSKTGEKFKIESSEVWSGRNYC